MGKEVREISPHVFPLSVWRVSRTSLTKNLHPLVLTTRELLPDISGDDDGNVRFKTADSALRLRLRR